MSVSRELAEIQTIFQEGVPLVFSVMDQQQILAAYWPIIKDALVEDKGIKDQRVKEGLMVTLSTKCDNSYCFVTHSYFLYSLGFTIDTIKDMIDELKFPDQVDDSEKWSLALKWAFYFGRPAIGPSNATFNPNKLIQQLTTPEEFRHLYKICTVIDLLNRFSEFYIDDIQIENDKMFLDSSAELKLPIPDLVKYYEKLPLSDGDGPVVAICSYCKNIQDTEGKWHALESVLSSLNRKSSFTHGICPDCYGKVVNEISIPPGRNHSSAAIR